MKETKERLKLTREFLRRRRFKKRRRIYLTVTWGGEQNLRMRVSRYALAIIALIFIIIIGNRRNVVPFLAEKELSVQLPDIGLE